MKHLNDIDQIFKDSLNGRREAVPPDIWKAVDERINKNNDTSWTSHNRLKSLVKLLILLIFSSAIFSEYRSNRKESGTTTHTIASNTLLHGDTAQKVLRNDEHSTQLSTTNLRLPVGDDANARLIEKLHSLADPLAMAGRSKQNSKINLNGSHEKTAYPVDRTMSSNTNTIGRGHLNQRSRDYQTSSLATKLKQSSQKADKQHGRILSKPMRTESGEIVEHINNSIDNRRNGALMWEPDSSKQLDRIVLISRSDVVPEANKSTSISKRSIQPWPFDYKIKDIQPPAVITSDLLSRHKNLLKKQPIMLHSMHTISIEPFGSVNYSFRDMGEGKHQNGRGVDKDDVKKSEDRGSSFSAGILVNYGINRNFFIQSGFVFSSIKTNIKAGKLYAKGDNNGSTRYQLISSSGYSYLSNRAGISLNTGDSIAINASSTTIKYISLPLSINYAWQRGKFVLKPGAGLSLNVLTHSSSSINVGNSSSQYTEKTTITGLNNVYLDGLFGLGVEYKLTPKLSLEMRPLVRWGITAINDDTPVKTFQNYLNLETGLKIKL